MFSQLMLMWLNLWPAVRLAVGMGHDWNEAGYDVWLGGCTMDWFKDFEFFLVGELAGRPQGQVQ